MKHSLASASSTASSSPPRSSITTNSAFDGRRQTRLKESQFVFKHGQKLHSYDPEKAPYPLSYDRHVLELESLDNRLVKYLRNGSISFMNFKPNERPGRCLDLGCGSGTWVIDAAKEWPDCEFVGFDLVNVQIPLKLLEPSLAGRIRWVHGNFLTTKLPFEDDEFDHVHIQSIARGVPENKWGVLFDEINRVLRFGGSVEVFEDDVLFPVLPRWFTAPLRVRPRRTTSVHLPDGSQRGAPSSSSDTLTSPPVHDHALLESLHKSVFEHRFINMKPSAVLPNYFTTYFRQVTLGPVLSFPMPPLPPLQPLPPQMASAYAVEPLGVDADHRASVITNTSTTTPGVRPPSLSFSSAVSARSVTSNVTSSSESSKVRSSSFSLVREVAGALSAEKLLNEAFESPFDDAPVTTPSSRYIVDCGLTDSCEGGLPSNLVTREQLISLNDRSLAMHLHRSYELVLACQEALWEELKDRIRNRRNELEPFGWEDEEEFEERQNRKKFERLLERYRTDMHSRVSLWSSLLDIGWPQPVREPLSKAELIEEERMREAMIEARRYASFEDQQRSCRSMRVLLGFKQ